MAVTLIPPTLSSNFCTKTPQQQANELIGGTQVTSDSSFTNLLIQAGTPTVDERTGNAWLKLEGAELLPDKLYKFADGVWASKHPIPASSPIRLPFFGTPAEVWSYDGGDGTDPASSTPTAVTGAMWTEDETLRGRLLMGAGDIPGSSPTKNLAVAESYGSGSVTQTAQQVAPHTHPLDADSSILDGNEVKVVNTGTGGAGLLIGDTGPSSQNLSVEVNEFTSTQEAMPIVPPVVGIRWIKRTNRSHYQS